MKLIKKNLFLIIFQLIIGTLLILPVIVPDAFSGGWGFVIAVSSYRLYIDFGGMYIISAIIGIILSIRGKYMSIKDIVVGMTLWFCFTFFILLFTVIEINFSRNFIPAIISSATLFLGGCLGRVFSPYYNE